MAIKPLITSFQDAENAYFGQPEPVTNTPLISDTGIDQAGWWAGLSADKLSMVYRDLHPLGTLSSAHYMVELIPYNDKGPLSDVPLLHHLPNQQDHAFWTMVPWLATQTSLPILNANTDSIQAGHFQQNYVTGNESGELSISFLDTREAHILRSARMIKDIMFRKDGTQSLPADYMMWLTISLFDRADRRRLPFKQTYLVALQTANAELSADSQDPMILPLSFIKMYPMLPTVT